MILAGSAGCGTPERGAEGGLEVRRGEVVANGGVLPPVVAVVEDGKDLPRKEGHLGWGSVARGVVSGHHTVQARFWLVPIILLFLDIPRGP